MPNKLHTDVYDLPIYETINYKDAYFSTPDIIPTTITIAATAEASGLANADLHSHATIAAPTDPRLAVVNLVAFLSLTIDSDAGTHDLRCRVYVDVQDAAHMLFDVSCTTLGAQTAATNLNSSTLATIFASMKDGAEHIYYYYFWSPANQSPVLSLASLVGAVGASDITASGKVCLTFLSPVDCELQVRLCGSCSAGTSTFGAYLNGLSLYDASYAVTDAGLTGITGSSSATALGGFTWQMLPASYLFSITAKSTTAGNYARTTAYMFYVKRWS
jgi:hypothetical protein